MKSRALGRYLSLGTGKASERIAAYGRGRICETPGCVTVLSTYNPERYCSLHMAGAARPSHPGVAG